MIAVYNEEAIVAELLCRVDAVLRAAGSTYEIIIVDDGSNDRTLEIVRSHVGRIAGLRVIELYRNAGQIAAISAGMSLARGTWILMMDGDLQHDPSDIPRFLSQRDSGADLIASYREKREETLRRRFISAIVNRINRALLGVRLTDFGSAYRLIRHEIIFLLKDRAGYVHYNTPDLFNNARRYIEIPIVQKKRASGASKWTLLMFVMFNLDILVTAMRPVLLAVWASTLGVVIGIGLYLLYLVGATSQVQALTGPASIILLSLLMFMLSVVWRELIRARQLALGTPMFLIRAVHSDCNLQASSLASGSLDSDLHVQRGDSSTGSVAAASIRG
ncbi:MAG: glycosyltransferase family 2 protein [Alphaproteobacteria bacterium]|nr:glycosyltransferase family 2 protein [Alphaproteobacteria bacterium]